MTEFNQENNVSQFFQIHAENPQARLVQQVVEIIQGGGVIVYPTDSAYALGCHLGDKHAMERIKRIRQLGDKHNFTLVCSDLSEIATYAKVDNKDYRTIKAHTPGAYTFILNATSEVVITSYSIHYTKLYDRSLFQTDRCRQG